MYMEIWTNILNVDSDFEGHANLQFKRKKKKKNKNNVDKKLSLRGKMIDKITDNERTWMTSDFNDIKFYIC